ncbi:hypothetical protein D3C71_2001310 [compost metagenome]
MARADLLEQGFALFAGGGVLGEVHVLDDQIHRLLFQQRQALLGRERVQGIDVVQREQHIECGADAGVVVNDQDRGHAAT